VSKLSKQIQYFRELQRIINDEITLENFNADHVGRVIQQALDWSRSQTIMKRPPKTDTRLCYYIACESWLKRLLASDWYKRFESFSDIEAYIWRRVAQVGWGLRIVGYDAVFIELWTDYVGLFKRWWEATSCGPR